MAPNKSIGGNRVDMVNSCFGLWLAHSVQASLLQVYCQLKYEIAHSEEEHTPC